MSEPTETAESIVGLLLRRVRNSDFVARVTFFSSFAFLCALLGILIMEYQWYPYWKIKRVFTLVHEVFNQPDEGRWFPPAPFPLDGTNPKTSGTAADGINLMSFLGADRKPTVTLMDMDGRLIHTWDGDWFRIWPDATHIPAKDQPKQLPGTDIHGVALLEDGSVVYNYSSLGLVRLDVCGRVMWRLPYRTHHSVTLDEDGVLWVPGQIDREQPQRAFPNHVPSFREETLLRVSQDGKILEEISLMQLLKDNEYTGLLHLSAIQQFSTAVSGDFLHVNDVEPFPRSMAPGHFGPGDVLISMRNTNTVFVFNLASRKIKYLTLAGMTRQHDPDFVDGNTLSVLDNNNSAPEDYGQNSRVMLLSPDWDQPHVYYQGAPDRRFYTSVRGKTQWLSNGDLLITSSRQGRAFEIDAKGTIVWEYFNLVPGGRVGLLSEVYRIPREYEKRVKDAEARLCH